VEFVREILEQFPDLDVSQLETDIARTENALVEDADPAALSPLSAVPVKIHNLLQTAMRRNLELTEAFKLAFNQRLFTPLFVISRASLETGCVAFDAWLRLEDALESQDMAALADIEARLMRTLLGTRAAEGRGNPDLFSAPNILTVVDRLNRRAFPRLRWYYDNVSDHTHPNFPGMLESYARPNHETLAVEYDSRPFERRSEQLQFAITGLAVGLGLGTTAWEQCREQWADLVDFCARAAMASARQQQPT